MKASVRRSGSMAVLLLAGAGLFATQALGELAELKGLATKTKNVIVEFKSTGPRYAKIAMNEDGSKILNVAFDESRGTGKGFDTMYVLECDKSGAVQKYDSYKSSRSTDGATAIYAFKPVIDKTVFKNGMAPGKIPFGAGFEYRRTETKVKPARPVKTGRTGAAAAVPEPVGPQLVEEFMFSASFSLLDEKQREWFYSFNGKMPVAESLDAAKAVKLGEGTPSMSVNSGRLDPKKSECGLGVDFQLGEFTFDCTQDGRGIPVALDIKNNEGKSLVHEQVRQDDLSYSVKSRTRRVSSGAACAPGGG